MADKFDFGQVLVRLERTKRELPVILAKQAERYFTESFAKGRLGEHKWAEVERRRVGTRSYKYPKKKDLSRRTSPILVRSGRLKRRVSNSVKEATWMRIFLAVDLPYAKIHNEGGNTGRHHATVIKARPFMKQTKELSDMQRKKVKEYMNKIW